MAWGIEETLLLILNVLIVALIVWALRRKVHLKLAEVEERHQRKAEHEIKSHLHDAIRLAPPMHDDRLCGESLQAAQVRAGQCCDHLIRPWRLA